MKKFILFGLLCLVNLSFTCNNSSARTARAVTAYYCDDSQANCMVTLMPDGTKIICPGRLCTTTYTILDSKLNIPDLPSSQVEYSNTFLFDNPTDNTKGIGIINGVTRYNATTNEIWRFEIDGETDYTDFNAWQTAVSGSPTVQP